jgi:hypothetical protein
MQNNLNTRAPRPADRDVSRSTHLAADARHDHVAAHGRAASRSGAVLRRAPGQMQAQNGASMAYQQGFTSGPGA